MPVESTSRATFHIEALDCPDEVALIEKGLASQAGIKSLNANFALRTLVVEYDEQKITREQISARLGEIGFPPSEKNLTVTDVSSSAKLTKTTLAGGALLIPAFALPFVSDSYAQSADGLAIASAVVAGIPVALAAWRSLRLLVLDMNVLMGIAAIGAIAIGYPKEAATAMFLFGVSLWLERFSLGRARNAIQSLATFAPNVAHRINTRSDDESADIFPEDVAPDQLNVDDLILVKPGERFPVDGQVVRGASSVNESPITGESMPVEKEPGDTVFAGTLNGESPLFVRATGSAKESTLAHIGRLVEQAQMNRAPIERFVDAFARRYTPAVIALAVAIATIPPLLGSEDVMPWLYRGLVMLVIACPCALVISTPVTIVCGLHYAARRGILIKGGQFLETASRIRCILWDKTGTITEGDPKVDRIECAPGYDVLVVLQIAAALESQSEHPLARAILAAAAKRDLDYEHAENVQALRGFGVQGNIQVAPNERREYVIASSRYFLGCSDDDIPMADVDSTATLAHVATGGKIIGTIHLIDKAREDARQAISDLHSLGVRPNALLTGDRNAVAQYIGEEVGLDRVHAELLPAQKVEWVKQYAKEFPDLAMVGDGVNDAPALAAAKVGIALGTTASDTALETADVVILSPHLSRVVEFLTLARRTRRVLWQNISISLSIKLATLILAAAGHATMWLAVLADVGASMIVVFNGMRLLGGESKAEVGDRKAENRESAPRSHGEH